jgi:hypothetical protein
MPLEFATALLRVIEKLIDGMTPEQKAQAWQQWFTFWEPVVKLMRREP